MSNLTVENVYTRQEAKELTKKHFWKLLGMMAIVVVIVYGLMIGGTALLAAVTGEAVEVTTTSTSYAAAIDGSDTPVYAIGSFVLMLAIALLSSGLGLGMIAAMIDLCKGDETVTVGRVFSRMGQCLKAFGLGLWVELKLFLWMLPGFLLFGLVAFGVLAVGDPQNAQPTEATAAVMAFLPVLFMILIFALVIPAAMRYMLSTYILADKPQTGVFECVRQSKAMMKGHKWQAFKLVIPTFLIMYVVVLVFTVAISAVMTLLANAEPIVSIVLTILLVIGIILLVLYYCIRISLAYCVFYLNRAKAQAPAVETVPME